MTGLTVVTLLLVKVLMTGLTVVIITCKSITDRSDCSTLLLVTV